MNRINIPNNILPVDLLFCKLLLRAALRLYTLPAAHPLCLLIWLAAHWKVKCHCLPIHHPINSTRLNPSEVKTISPVRRSPSYNPAFEIIIPPSKEVALPFAILTNTTVQEEQKQPLCAASPVMFWALLNIIWMERGWKVCKLTISLFWVGVAVQWSKFLLKITFSALDISMTWAFKGLIESK